MSTVKTNNVQVGQSGTATNNFTLYQPTSPDGTVRLGVGNSGATTADVLIANSGGTVGVGVTPNTWGSPVTKAFQVGNASVSNYSGETNCYLTGNAYYNSGWKYVVTKAASMYQFEGLNHTWSSAASGTAGTAITFTDVLAVSKDKSLALQGATTQTGTGITFPATQSASSNANTLDDYEEGTFTLSNGGNTTYTTRSGRYTKIGNFVKCCFFHNINTIGTGSATTLTGLPFAASSTAPTINGGVVTYISGLAVSALAIGVYADSAAQIIFMTRNANDTNATTQLPAVMGNSFAVYAEVSYLID